jgi:hypothetical protein
VPFYNRFADALRCVDVLDQIHKELGDGPAARE